MEIFVVIDLTESPKDCIIGCFKNVELAEEEIEKVISMRMNSFRNEYVIIKETLN